MSLPARGAYKSYDDTALMTVGDVIKDPAAVYWKVYVEEYKTWELRVCRSGSWVSYRTPGGVWEHCSMDTLPDEVNKVINRSTSVIKGIVPYRMEDTEPIRFMSVLNLFELDLQH